MSKKKKDNKSYNNNSKRHKVKHDPAEVTRADTPHPFLQQRPDLILSPPLSRYPRPPLLSPLPPLCIMRMAEQELNVYI